MSHPFISLADRTLHHSLMQLSEDTLRRIGLDENSVRPTALLTKQLGSIAAAEKAIKKVVDHSRTLGVDSAAGIWGLGVGADAAKRIHLIFDKCAVDPNGPDADRVQPMALPAGDCGCVEDAPLGGIQVSTDYVFDADTKRCRPVGEWVDDEWVEGGEGPLSIPSRPALGSTDSMHSSTPTTSVTTHQTGSDITGSTSEEAEVVAIVGMLPAPLAHDYATVLAREVRKRPWFLERLRVLYDASPGEFCQTTTQESSSRLHPHQLLAYVHFSNVARWLERTQDDMAAQRESLPRGFLMYHSTGSGKTAVQAAVVDACRSLLRTHNWRVYFVTTAENRDDNGLGEIRRWLRSCPGLQCIQGTVEEQLSQMQIRERGSDPSFLSYTSFVNRLAKGEIQTQRSIFILDEGHSLFAPQKESDASQAGAFRRAAKALQALDGHVLYIVLTATPGDSVGNALRLMRLLDWPSEQAPATEQAASRVALSRAKEHTSMKESGSRAHLELSAIDAAWREDADDDRVDLYNPEEDLTPDRLRRLGERLQGCISHVDMRDVRGMFPTLETVDVVVRELGHGTK